MTSELRREIRETGANFLELCATSNMEMRGLWIAAYPGSGKSYTIWRLLMDTPGVVFFYLSPRHGVIESMCDMDRIPHLYSKSYIPRGGDPLCRYLATHRRAAMATERAVLPPGFFCPGCTFSDTCNLLETSRAVLEPGQSWTGVHHHMFTYLDKHLEKRRDYTVAVIDENPFNAMLSHCNLSIRNIRSLRVFMEGEFPAFDGVLSALASHLGGDGLEIPPVDDWDPVAFDRRYREKLMAAFQEGRAWYPRYNQVKMVMKLAGHPGMAGRMVRVMVAGDKLVARVSWFHRNAINKIRVPLICLDGSGSHDTWKWLASDYVIRKVIDEKWRHQNVIQLKGAGNFYLGTWRACGRSHPNFEMIRRVCGLSRKKVIICCSKSIQSIIENHLKDVRNMSFANFYALTSDNSLWREASTLIVAWKPSKPPDVMRAIQETCGMSDEILEYMETYGEIVQGIGRLRQNIDVVETPGRTFFDKKEERRDGLYILICPEMPGKNPVAVMTSHDADSYLEISRKDYIECLRNGSLDPVDYYKKKMLYYLVEPRTMTQVRRKFPNKEWIDRSIDRLLEEGEITRAGRRMVMKFSSRSSGSSCGLIPRRGEKSGKNS